MKRITRFILLTAAIVAIGNVTALAQPTMSLIPPVRPANQVISIFGYHPARLASVNLNTADATKHTTINDYHANANTIVMRLDNFDFQRFEFGATPTTTIDASKMDSLHVDIYPTTETTISAQLLMPTAGGVAVPLTPLVLNVWNSFNIPLTTFGVTTSTLSQFEFLNGTLNTFFMDNLYFFTNKVINSIPDVVSMNGIKYYPSMVSSLLTVKAESPISQIIISNLLGQSVKTVLVNSIEGNIDLSALSAGNYFVTFKMANTQQATQKIVKL